MSRVSSLKKHFVISADTRDLNYDKYFTKGRKEISKSEDYNSHNVKILEKEQVKETLMKLDVVREYL